MQPRTAVLGTIVLLSITACDAFFGTRFDQVEPAILYEAQELSPAPAAPTQLTVMTYNIKYGGGRLKFFWECNGTRYNMSAEEVYANLDGLAAKLREVDPDIVLLQEIDVMSKRSAYIDQVQFLLDYSPLNYGAYASAWKADYVPSDGIGRMESGNAILSRWPLSEAERIALPLIDSQSGLERQFYLRRNITKAAVQLPGFNGHTFYAVNVHTAAFAEDDTKQEHLDIFKQTLDDIHRAGDVFVAGGDLNSIPVGSPQWHNYADEQCDDSRFEGDDYRGEETWLNELFDSYQAAIPLAIFQQNPRNYFSYSGDQHIFWNRKLDYLFTNGTFERGSGVVHQDERTGLPTLPLSDHAPVVVRMEVQP